MLSIAGRAGPHRFFGQDFNLIEEVIGRLKTILSKAGEPNISGLWGLNGKLVDSFQPGGCANYFRSWGYEPN